MTKSEILKNISSAIAVFLVALPLCLGIALASDAPLSSGLIAGIIGGIVVGFISGSSTSVSGPAAGLSALVLSQIHNLGAFSTFLAVLTLAGIFQIILGIAKTGSLAAFFPNSVIKGLLAAIGIIIILKQIPHLFGYDPTPIGSFTFFSVNSSNTLTQIYEMFLNINLGSSLIGITSIFIILFLTQKRFKKYSSMPVALIVVVFGIIANELFKNFIPSLEIMSNSLVQIPILKSSADIKKFFIFPNFNNIFNLNLIIAALTLAVVASLETLLNIEATDKLDTQQRTTPTNRELIAQGAGNIFCGLLGGLPVTSVIVRSSTNINAGATSKISSIIHGFLILISLLFLPTIINKIPLSVLAAILIITGIKLASPYAMKQMLHEGRSQYIPYFTTIFAIIFSDLLIGVLLGLLVSFAEILYKNLQTPLKIIIEQHAFAKVIRIELASQVTFLSKAKLEETLKAVKPGDHILLDARNCHYIDPEIIDIIDDFTHTTASAHKVEVSLLGFENIDKKLTDKIQYVDYSTRELQENLTPEKVLDILKAGNERFRKGETLTRNFSKQADATSLGQFPMAAVLSCIDSRAPVEIVFDLGLGDILTARVAGNTAQENIIGSLEFACAVAGAKLIVILGHTSCGAVSAAIDLKLSGKTAFETTACENLDSITDTIQKVICCNDHIPNKTSENSDYKDYVNTIAEKNVLNTISEIQSKSTIIRKLILENKINIVGGIYNIATGEVMFLNK